MGDITQGPWRPEAQVSVVLNAAEAAALVYVLADPVVVELVGDDQEAQSAVLAALVQIRRQIAT